MTGSDYPFPVSRLLTLGDGREMRPWPDYPALGIGLEHVPDLVHMIQDEALHRAPSERLEVWAPVHAWRTLGQLGAEAAIEPLIGLLEQIDQDYEEWIADEVPEVLGLIGPAAVPRLTECLTTPHEGMWAQTTAAFALAEIGQRHPETRDDCVVALTRGLAAFASQDPGLNGFLIGALVDLDGVEAAPLMENAFAAHRVDPMILGDWADVQVQLGLLEEREAPAPYEVRLPEPLSPESPQPTRAMPDPEWKEEKNAERRRRDKRKARRKQQKKARRKQRKRN
jgi:hypothetical protein